MTEYIGVICKQNVKACLYEAVDVRCIYIYSVCHAVVLNVVSSHVNGTMATLLAQRAALAKATS